MRIPAVRPQSGSSNMVNVSAVISKRLIVGPADIVSVPVLS